MEITIAGHTYRTGRLDARKQFHLSRKLLPLAMALGKGLSEDKRVQDLIANREGEAPPLDSLVDVIMSALEPASGVIAQMPEEDMDYVINTCMRVCDRQAGTAWAPCMATGSTKLMYDDMDMPVMVRLACAVVMENIGNFFLEGRPQSLS